MSFTARPIDDFCPDIAMCVLCGGKVCLSCGGDSSPITCAEDTHCTACVPACSICTNDTKDPT